MSNTKRRELDSAISQVGAALAELRSEVDGIEGRMREVQGQIEVLESAPVSLDDWGLFLRAYIVKQGARFTSPLLAHRLLSPASPGGDMTPFNARPWGDFERGGDVLPHDMVRMFSGGEFSMPALCALFPDQLFEMVLANMKERIGGQWGNEDATPVAERRVLCAVLVRERDDLRGRRAELQAEIDRLSMAVG